MDPKKIERINELARKKRTVGLTEGEVQEQAPCARNIWRASGPTCSRCWTTCASSARTVPSNACKRNALTKSIPHFRGKVKEKTLGKNLAKYDGLGYNKAGTKERKQISITRRPSPNGDQVKTKQLELPAEW